jgi:hypothetical protein
LITGAKYWDKLDRYYKQSNNSVETMIKKLGIEWVKKSGNNGGKSPGWLETCGPTAAVMCMDAMDILPWQPYDGVQVEDILTLWLNNPCNYGDMRASRPELNPDEWMGNRVPQYYPPAVKKLFKVSARFASLSWEDIASMLLNGHAIQLCKVTPGHYIAAVAYDSEKNEIIYHDPWPEQYADGQGFCRRITRPEFVANIHPWGVIYS